MLALLAGCAGAPDAEPSPEPPAPAGPFALASPAFADGEAIPVEHTCDGAETSPPLVISGAPSETATFALVMGDPDVPIPQAPQRNFTHWVVWDAPALDGGATFEAGDIPAGAVEGANGGNANGYAGPCPPPLSPAHRYVFTLYAVDGALGLAAGSTREELEAALDGRVVATTSFTGLYARALPT